ncbi:hypothetical protein SPRG_21816 [Saprolegnia parasitica CBS 223.65]|uniref:Uncharacterized protein n=1 Tax=Saprolegnia parasitica (strain CBS 223.65) TaxID=695850 RepID=A0A067BSK2_SAPPC|nr:hypothetical protein SPRG_21816 [Saprolegnia parasitica CBS 223.65]KDO17637.1 hypothetical protein SPRG_21816 [Saprolegnia parasitica CBS 223.65]|eukprot:XP_012211655.1 hypothetical protein SPRG_21816 [Saprolegnia parasitica CBS 223.65]
MTPRTPPMMATSPLKDAMASELKGKPVSPYVKMAAGMAGGVAEACLLQPLDEDGDGKQLEVWKTLINGLVAGSLGPCLNSPMDVIKTRLMAQETVKGVEPKYRGFVHAFGVIAREEGNAALWKGLVPRLTRMAPGQAITWTVVMRVTSFFENN